MQIRRLALKYVIFLAVLIPLLIFTGCTSLLVREESHVFKPISKNELADIKSNKEIAKLLGSGKEMVRRRFIRFDYNFFNENVVKRARRGTINPVVNISLFSDLKIKMVTKTVTKNKKGVFVWTARPKSKYYSRADLSFNKHTIFGVIQVNNKVYEFMPVKNGIVSVTEYDQRKYQNEAPPVVPKKRRLKRKLRLKKERQARLRARKRHQNLKVLVLLPNPYSIFCKSNWFPFDITSIVEASYQANLNKVYSAVQPSGVTATVVVKCVNYNPVGSSLSADLSWVRSNAGVATLRNTTNADLVSLIVPNAAFCGRGYYNFPVTVSSEAWAFSVVKASCALGNFSFAHELGHNVGMQHDRIAKGAPTSTQCNYGSIFPVDINFGPISVNYTARSVMSYGSSCGSCTRMGLYSNPFLIDFSFIEIGPMGVVCTAPPVGGNYNRANNRQQLIDAAPTVSGFR